MKVWNRHAVPSHIQAVYVGRGTPLGNPFPITQTDDRASVIKKYRAYAAFKLSYLDKEFVDGLLDLAGTDNISCSCSPQACHGDVIAEIWDYIRQKDNPLLGIKAWVRDNGYPYLIEKDGKDHINIYSKAATSVGRLWTNMQYMPFTSQEFGYTTSVEAVWHFVSTGCKHPEILQMKPFDAKKYAKTLPKDKPQDFKDIIIRALKDRMAEHPIKRALLGASHLPLTHYYHYGTNDTIVYTPHDWLIQAIEDIRAQIKSECQKVVIAGSRDFYDYDILEKIIYKTGFNIKTVISGKAKGADTLGEIYAKKHNLNIEEYPADWDQYGKSAGYIRNSQMGDNGDAAIVICVNNSKGSLNMIEIMRKLNKPCYAVMINRS